MPLVRPVTVALSDAPCSGLVDDPRVPAGMTTGVCATPAMDGVMVKLVTALPLSAGTVQLTWAWAGPPVAPTPVGASGTAPDWSNTVSVSPAGTASRSSPSLRHPCGVVETLHVDIGVDLGADVVVPELLAGGRRKSANKVPEADPS